MNRKFEVVMNYALEKGYQVQPNILELCEVINIDEIKNVIQKIINKKKQSDCIITKKDFDEYINDKIIVQHDVLFDPTSQIASDEGMHGYYSLFKDRFTKLKKTISKRSEISKIYTISEISNSKNNTMIYVCGLLLKRDSEKKFTRLLIDDLTDSLEILVFEEDVKNIANMLLLDQFAVFKIQVNINKNIVCKDIILPDIPKHKHNRSRTNACAAFLSDLHIGSKYFMEKEINNFISWLSSDNNIAKKIRFIVISGDLIDGIGIYPDQKDELDLDSIDKQLYKAVSILKKIPKHIKIFIIPGNHDPGRRALPQPAIQKKHKYFQNCENIFLLGNPSLISLNNVKILAYHGQSIDDVVKTTPGMHYNKPTAVMKLLLRSRHLSPIYGSRTPIAPESHDMLIINEIPDIFITGHVHIIDYDSYRGILLINSGTWQKQTPFQSSVGITPTPGVVMIIDLKTFTIYQNNF